MRIREGKWQVINSHRIAWMIANDADIPAGLVIMHTCDNPPCCNPAHLRLDTQQANVADRDAKGRGGSGKMIATEPHGAVPYIGVTLLPEIRKKSGKRHIRRYRATVGKKMLGNFMTAEEAARVVDTERLRVYGPDAPLNFPRHEQLDEAA